MTFQKNHIRFELLILFLLMCTIQNRAKAKSVYAIPQHSPSKILNVYDVLEGAQESQLEYRAAYNLKFDGPGDIVIDTRSDILFVTFESRNQIQLINARTFTSEGEVVATSADDLAGLALDYIDEDTVYLYTVDRGTNKLFVYEWNADFELDDPNRIRLIPPNPPTGNDYHELQPADTDLVSEVKAGGLAIDPKTRTLYVSQFSNSGGGGFNYSQFVHAFDIDNDFDPNDMIDLGDGNEAVDLDVDSQNGWLYAGGIFKHDNLIRYDLKERIPGEPNDNYVWPVGAGVIGLAAYHDPNIVYMTTYNYKLEVWDIDKGEQIDWEPAGDPSAQWGGGAGVCIADVDFVPPFVIGKTDDIDNCASPRAGEITYTISYMYQWGNDPNFNIIDNIEIVDYLSERVDFIEELNPGWNYNDSSHTATWVFDPNNLESIASIELTVQGDQLIRPNQKIQNTAEIKTTTGSQEFSSKTTIETKICDCGNFGQIIRVDEYVDVADPNGSSWDTAFKYLQDALEIAFPCDEIWVAEADVPYKPTDDPCDSDATFNLPNWVALYGGFQGIQATEPETKRYERNWYTNETTLSGDINDDDNSEDPNSYSDNLLYVVTDANVISVLDGFSVKGGSAAGIYCDERSPLIQHNKITGNDIAIYCLDSQYTIIKNNWLYSNNEGIYLEDSVNMPNIYNNTIVNNESTGILVQSGIKPNVENCIIWGNTKQLSWDYTTPDLTVTYSCIEDSNDTTPTSPYYNINTDPCFVTGADIYLIESDSLCIDKGNPDADYAGLKDIDKHTRVLDGNDDETKRIDMGADEYCNETSNDADFNEDEIVNYIDFVKFGTAWLQGPSDPNWNNGLYDLDGNGTIIDANDLALFAKEWLWMSCSKMVDAPIEEMMMSMGGGMQMMSLETAATPQLEPTVEEQIEQYEYLIDWLEDLWKTDKSVREEVDKDAFNGMIESLEAWLNELEDSL